MSTNKNSKLNPQRKSPVAKKLVPNGVLYGTVFNLAGPSRNKESSFVEQPRMLRPVYDQSQGNSGMEQKISDLKAPLITKIPKSDLSLAERQVLKMREKFLIDAQKYQL